MGHIHAFPPGLQAHVHRSRSQSSAAHLGGRVGEEVESRLGDNRRLGVLAQ